jgi:aspartate racemase
MQKIGLIGGISWVSTLDYYKLINEGMNKKLGGLNFAECIIYSLNFGDIQEKTWENCYELLLNACNSLKRSSATAIALCANTAHLYADKLQDEVALPFIHIGVATAKAVKQQGLRKVGLIGTKYTMELGFYRNKLEENGLEVIIPQTQDIRDYIQHTVKEELGRGIINNETKLNYINIVADLVNSGAEGIILGCTEIPMLISQTDFSIPVFDTTKIHSQAIIDFALAEIPEH